MEHLIRFHTAEGIEGSRSAASLDEAITFVEHLRNTEGAADVRLFRLTEVPIEFRAYYRVEVGSGAIEVNDTAAPEVPLPMTSSYVVPRHAPRPPMPLSPDTEPPRQEPFERAPGHEVTDPGTANGRKLFSRS